VFYFYVLGFIVCVFLCVCVFFFARFYNKYRNIMVTMSCWSVPPIQCFIHWLCARYKLFLWLWLFFSDLAVLYPRFRLVILPADRPVPQR